MALNGTQSAHEEDQDQLTPNPFHLQPRRSKSHDEPSPGTVDGEPATAQEPSQANSLKEPPNTHSESDPGARHPERDEITVLQSNRQLPENGAARPKSSSSIASNGDGRRGSGEVFAQSFFGPDQDRDYIDQVWGINEHPGGAHNSTAQSSSPKIVPYSYDPDTSTGEAVNGWSSNFPFDGKQTGIFTLGQTEEWRARSPESLTNDLEEPASVDVQQDLGQEDSTLTGGGVRLPVEPSTDVPAIDTFPPDLEAGQAEDGAETFAKQLRRFQKRIDTILLKRTQWRQEYDKLENCRRYLRESTTELTSALQIQKAEDVTPDNPRTRRRRRRRTRIMGEGTGAEKPVERLVQRLTQADSEPSTTGAAQDGSESVQSNGTAASREKIHTLFQRYLDDMEALSRQEGIERTLMEDLSNREFHVNKMLEDIQKNMRSSSFAEDLRTELLEGSLLSQDSSFKTPSEENLPPLIAEYFDLQGNIGIYLERLQDLDYEHQEGLQEREFVRDRGDPLDPPDEEFTANYKAQREQTEQDLTKARDQLEIVDARCMQAGLDPEMHRNAERTPRSVSPMPSAGPDPTSLVPVKPKNEVAPHPVLESTSGAQSSLRIEGWLRRIPDELLDTEPVAPPLVPQYEEKKPSGGSLASFEVRSFDLGVFGLPKRLDGDEYKL